MQTSGSAVAMLWRLSCCAQCHYCQTLQLNNLAVCRGGVEAGAVYRQARRSSELSPQPSSTPVGFNVASFLPQQAVLVSKPGSAAPSWQPQRDKGS